MNVEYLKNSIEKNNLYQKKNKKDKYINNSLLHIVEQFIIKKKLVCYGGTAINNILPKNKQFYNYEVDIPDYDFFSTNAMQDAKELCNILSYENVYHIEAKSAFFYGTYKVFVNFVPIADITQIDNIFYKTLLKESIKVDKILYTPPHFLRMSLHQELARPLGDTSRWEKIYNRMNLLNIYYPIQNKKKINYTNIFIPIKNNSFIKIYQELENIFINHNCIFCNLCLILDFYKKHIKNITLKQKDKKLETMIIYCNNILELNQQIKDKKLNDITIKLNKSNYKFINDYAYIYYKNKLISIVIETNSCLSYISYNKMNIGNIDTLLNLYFSFLLMEQIKLPKSLIEYTIYQLYKIILNYDKLLINKDKIPHELNRFNLPCLGKQDDFQHIAKERVKQYQKYKNQKSSSEYKKWFFKYTPILKNKKVSKSKTLKKSNISKRTILTKKNLKK